MLLVITSSNIMHKRSSRSGERRSEANTVDLSQYLCEDVGARESRALLGDDVDGDHAHLGELSSRSSRSS